MNWLFLVFVCAVGAGVAVTRRRLGPQRQQVTVRGPVPGYSYTDGKEFALDPIDELERNVDWWAHSVEEFHSRHRARIVLSLGLRPRVSDEDAMRLLHVCAQEIASRSQAHVVYAEGLSGGVLRTAYLWAPDGMGWSGADSTREIAFAAHEH